MDYRQQLSQCLLGEKNISYLINKILENFKISDKACGKCQNIIKKYLMNYLNNINRYPENNIELIEAIEFLNNRCFNEFENYMLTKFPPEAIIRNYQPPCDQMALDDPNENEPVTEYEEIIELTENEKNQLLAQYHDQPKNNQILEYLANPQILQMFMHLVNQNKKLPTKEYIIDDILDSRQVEQLLKGSTNTSAKESIPTTPKIHDHHKITDLDDLPSNTPTIKHSKNIFEQKSSENIFNQSTDDTFNKSSDEPTANPSVEPINKPSVEPIVQPTIEPVDKPSVEPIVQPTIKPVDKPSEDSTDEPSENHLCKLDLDNLNSKTLLQAAERIKELGKMREIFQNENDENSVKKIDEEKQMIINAMKAYREKFNLQINKNKEKMIVNKKKEDNVEILNLQLDPTNDYRDLQNITIGFNSEEKIKEISLISYYVPFNSHNVTRFNNSMVVYINNQINNISIPPAKYELEPLLELIKKRIPYLDFSVDKESKKITIRNTINQPFDLLTDKSNMIFPLLGFTDRASNYKGELFYQGNQSYNLEANQKIIISMDGSNTDPSELEFNVEKKLENPVVLKKVSRAMTMKKMSIKLKDELDQYYDFILPFKMAFKIIYD